MNPEKFYSTYRGKLIKSDTEFKTLVTNFKKVIKNISESDDGIIGFKPNHFITCGFIKRGNNFVYISVPDVRYDENWCNKILVRRARNEKDFFGMSNNFVSILDLENKINKLLNNE